MSSTASKTIGPADGLWRELLGAVIRQFPPPNEIGEERGVVLASDPMYIARIGKAFDPQCDERAHDCGYTEPGFQRRTWYQNALQLAIGSFPVNVDCALAIELVNNQAELKRIIREDILLLSALDKFVFVKTFDIVVPADYRHGTQLGSFKKKHGKSLHYFNDDLTDGNFSRVSAQLRPGQRVTVTVHRQAAPGPTTSEERMTFLRALPGNKFYGAQGASLVYEQQADQLERDYAYVAMDEKENLPLVDGVHWVPDWDRGSDGDYGFYLGDFEREWHAGLLLFSFSDADIKN